MTSASQRTEVSDPRVLFPSSTLSFSFPFSSPPRSLTCSSSSHARAMMALTLDFFVSQFFHWFGGKRIPCLENTRAAEAVEKTLIAGRARLLPEKATELRGGLNCRRVRIPSASRRAVGDHC